MPKSRKSRSRSRRRDRRSRSSSRSSVRYGPSRPRDRRRGGHSSRRISSSESSSSSSRSRSRSHSRSAHSRRHYSTSRSHHRHGHSKSYKDKGRKEKLEKKDGTGLRRSISLPDINKPSTSGFTSLDCRSTPPITVSDGGSSGDDGQDESPTKTPHGSESKAFSAFKSVTLRSGKELPKDSNKNVTQPGGRPAGSRNKRILKPELEQMLKNVQEELEAKNAELAAAKSKLTAQEYELQQYQESLGNSHCPVQPKRPDGSKLTMDAVKRVLPNLDNRFVQTALYTLVENVNETSWDDILGLHSAKDAVKETVVLPRQRPDLFTGPRAPSNGILLYGPPGTGKTLMARCIASETKNVNFFALTAASVGSKWVGDSENIIRAIFQVARSFPPSIIFIDELESLLSSRDSKDGDTARKIKTEFIAQMDGIADSKSKPLVIGATNRPQDLDQALLRRLPQLLYVPLPDLDGRKEMLKAFLKGVRVNITDKEFSDLALRTDYYSASDLKNLAREASMRPIREQAGLLATISKNDIRGVSADDIYTACLTIKPSVRAEEITNYEDFKNTMGGY